MRLQQRFQPWFADTVGCAVGYGVLVGVLAVAAVPARAEDFPHVVEAPPLSPQEQLTKFHLPPGFEIQLVASEPEVRKPMNFSFDAAGRLWFTGSVEYPYPRPLQEQEQCRDLLRIIHGIGANGAATKITTFADKLNLPIGVTPIGSSEAIVFSVPNIYRVRDANGDGVAELREVMFGPFGQRDTHGLNNSFTHAVDGWVYACHGYVNSSAVQGTDGEKIQLEGGNVYRFRPDGSHIEFFTHGQVNPFGLSFDTLGNLFSADCHTLPAYMLLRGAYYPSFGKPHDGLGFGPQIMQHYHGSTGIAGIVRYEAEEFPEDYRGNLFIGNPITHRVNRDKLVAHGSSYEAVEQPDFITCEDPWFRPVEVKLGPDGALYIGDFYNCIIGHYEVPLDHPKRDRERGRIWRVVYKGTAEVPARVAKRLPLPNLANAGAEQLIEWLADSNITVRTLATNELAGRVGKSCVPALRERVANRDSSPLVRSNGVWVLERLGSLSEKLVGQLCDDPAPVVRIHMLKALSERGSAAPSLAAAKIARGMLSDDDAFVRRAAADCLGQHPSAENLQPLLDLWRATPSDDAQLIHTIRMALRDNLKRDDIMAVVVDADFSKEQREQLAQLCLGVPTAPAANLALTFLQSNPKAIQNLGDAISPLLRYVSEERLHEVYDLAIDFRAERMPKRKRKDGDEGGQEQAILLGLHRAAQERGIELPQEIRAWAQEYAISKLAARRGSIRELGIEVAREIKIQAALPQLLEIAENDIGSDLRIGALIACVTIDGPGSVEMLNRMMHKEQEELALRQRAARSLGMVNNDAARAHLVGFLATAPERLAVEVAAALAKSKPGGETLLATIAAGKASPRLLQEPPVSAQLAQQNIPGLAEQIEKLTAGLPTRDEQLRQVIEDRLAAFAKHKPDLARGKQVFTKNCGVCHKLSGEGAKIGPELDGIGVRGPTRLMEDILDPNRNVDQAFRTTLLTTVEGQPISGLLLRQEGKVLILVDSQGKEQRLSEDDIEPDSKQVSPLSPMPANHRDTIPEAEFYDLLGYLLEQKPKE